MPDDENLPRLAGREMKPPQGLYWLGVLALMASVVEGLGSCAQLDAPRNGGAMLAAFAENVKGGAIAAAIIFAVGYFLALLARRWTR